ncbi:hypothetical protein AAG570_012636 [Ranatra chinensis]|uniref:ethanolamine kinase n=1 Tax=Ranatra chinensis TaxID=642074 RepID=A0ABD0YEJ9_9HEMI
MVLVRVYGQNTELLIDRKAETANFLLLQKAGYAPRLYATFNNGLAYAYVPGEVLTSNMVKNPSIYPLVARMLAKLHNVECGPSMSKEPVIWRRTYHYLSLIPPTFTKCQLQKRFVECFPDGIDFLKQELQELQQNLSDIKTDVVFCHNDLLLGNIIHNDGKVTFIDYEYAAYNYQAYDIGNHFAEFAGVSEVDYSRYPNKEFQISWLNIYLSEYNQCKNAAGTVTFSEINDLYLEVNKFSLASHLHWAIWALVQAHHSAIDFDFIG